MNRIRPLILPGLFALLALAAFYPALRLLVEKWLASEDYSHAFLVVPAVAYMIWQRREWLFSGPGNPAAGLILAALALLAYLFTLIVQIPTLIFLATLAFVTSVLVFFAGFRALPALTMPLLLLLLAIPIPNQVLAGLTASLQLSISAVSETIIRALAIPLFREGNVLHVPGMSFQVVEACSGIRSLISMTTMSLLIGYYFLTRVPSTILLLLFSIPVALLINLLRVVGLVLAYHYFRLDLSAGLAHTLTGLILFMIGLALLFAGQRVLELWETRNKNT